VKNSVLALVLFAGGCALPQQQDRIGNGGNDLATLSGVGGSGGDDLAVAVADAGPPPEGADLAGADLATTVPVPDLATPVPVPDLATPPPIPDLATPPPPPPDMSQCTHNTPSSTCSLFPQCGCAPGQMCNIQDETGKSLCGVSGVTPPFGACNPNTNGDGVCVAGMSDAVALALEGGDGSGQHDDGPEG